MSMCAQQHMYSTKQEAACLLSSLTARTVAELLQQTCFPSTCSSNPGSCQLPNMMFTWQLHGACASLLHWSELRALMSSCPCRNYARSCSPSAPDSQAVAAATIRLEATNTRGPVPELPEELVLPVASASGTCNAYLPNGPSTLPRFLWVIQHLVASGMYVAVSYGHACCRQWPVRKSDSRWVTYNSDYTSCDDQGGL